MFQQIGPPILACDQQEKSIKTQILLQEKIQTTFSHGQLMIDDVILNHHASVRTVTVFFFRMEQQKGYANIVGTPLLARGRQRPCRLNSGNTRQMHIFYLVLLRKTIFFTTMVDNHFGMTVVIELMRLAVFRLTKWHNFLFM